MTSFAARHIPLLLAACAALVAQCVAYYLTHRPRRAER